ncbi:MetQ/NlpA family ABC transporter substrate-binding protein [Ignatzschineria rhizosphaerae]|uniref:MetQ/NlpA family ABC transporter substrate-binding protein n=1 Tax=Ignatzschineria rhizosphaerae TaxID=2923279 RepID=A0ABY3X134_9GAMM|nr:MetQ/NlpA family ABC transporter substrate-binding protein [Ignatzschineria rhizosphaerae]UNM96566.1 MetQ/NlpA family ABC transporter substrate-binding protein [Ignatzschineria rhizosphaerae]
MQLLKQWTHSFKVISLMAITLLIAACGEGKDSDKKIVFGFGPSTYAEQFEKGIRPILEDQGYEVVVKILSQNMQINPALKDGSIDVAGHQSIAYMEEMNKELSMNMVKLADTASAPQSLRSTKHQSLDDVKAGMTVAIPNDPVNAERAARILESIGWVEVTNEEVSRFSERDIISLNGIKVLLLDPAQGLRILEDVDFAVINGNYVANAGLKMTDALVVEETPEEHVVMISIRGEDQDKQWAKDLKAAYESDAFASYIQNESLYDGFILPTAWQK